MITVSQNKNFAGEILKTEESLLSLFPSLRDSDEGLPNNRGREGGGRLLLLVVEVNVSYSFCNT